jgi:hypothetical protein
VTERDLPGQAGEDVEPEGGDGVDEGLRAFIKEADVSALRNPMTRASWNRLPMTLLVAVEQRLVLGEARQSIGQPLMRNTANATFLVPHVAAAMVGFVAGGT